MNSSLRIATTCFAAALAVGAALAQAAGDAGAPPTLRVPTGVGTEGVPGGADEEARAAMAQMQPAFPMRLVFTDRIGECIAADHVDVGSGAVGAPVGATARE